jgi:hypothetical protein
MNITANYKSIVAAQNTKKIAFEKLREKYLKETNKFYGDIIRPETNFINKATEELQSALGSNFRVTNSSCFITVAYCGFTGEFPYQKNREIASINLKANRMTFRFDGAPNVTKQITFAKDLTTEKIVKLIYKYGIMLRAYSANQ